MPLKYIKNEDGKFVCPHCPSVSYRNQSSMHYHLKKHEEMTTFTCKACKKGFLQKAALDLHIHSKHPELASSDDEHKRWNCPFDDCSFSALTKGNCIIHCLRVHFQEEIKSIMLVDSETKEIECTECCKEFSSSCAFYYHCKSCVPIDKASKKYEKFKLIA